MHSPLSSGEDREQEGRQTQVPKRIMAKSAPQLCTRCQLRTANDRTIFKYEKPTTEAFGFSCSLCLGVLYESSITTVMSRFESLVAPIKNTKTVKINTTIPASIAVVRDRAFQISLTRGRAGAVLVSLREALKWTLSSRLEKLFGYRYNPEAQLFLDVFFSHPDSAQDVSFIAAADRPTKMRRFHDPYQSAKGSSATHIIRVMSSMSDEDFERIAPADWIPPPPSQHTVSVSAEMSTAPVFLAGCYNKWSRIVSQTPWFVDDDEVGGGGGGDGDGSINGGGRGRGSDRRRRGGRGRGRGRGGGRRGGGDSFDEMQLTNGESKADTENGQSIIDKHQGNSHADVVMKTADEQKKRTALSVEDAVLQGIKKVLQPEKATFCAGGREDVDVRMLGGGRPFFVEVTNPKITSDCVTPEMVRDMLSGEGGHGAAVSVVGLRQVSRNFIAHMKTVEASKRKHYRCVVWCSAALTRAEIERRLHIPSEEEKGKGNQKEGGGGDDDEKGLILHQRTPLRVLHRRTQAVRKRSIYDMKVISMVSPHFFVLELTAQAGTYIKEFVHGDCGRTVPSLSSIFECDADILQLDVVKVDMGELQKGLLDNTEYIK